MILIKAMGYIYIMMGISMKVFIGMDIGMGKEILYG